MTTIEPTPTVQNQETQRRVTVTFQRKVNLEALGAPKYESAELFMSVTDYLPLEMELADVADHTGELSSLVKASVLTQLGLDWEETAEGVVVERIRNGFGPGVQVIDTTSAPTPQVPPSTDLGPDVPPYAGEKLDFRNDKDKLTEQREWAANRFVALGSGWTREFYDNRESKKTKNHPDFRHKTHGVSMYISDVKKAGGESLL